MRRVVWLILALPCLLGPGPPSKDDPEVKDKAAPGTKIRRERLHKIYLTEALSYTIHRDSTRAEKVELRHEPVYSWTNPIRNGAQDGEVFVWTCRGRAEVIGTFFSYPATGPRSLHHELHALSTTILDIARPGANSWTPLAAGVELAPIAEAPKPAASAPQRLTQMRALTRDFAAGAEDMNGRRWQFRLLPQPLYRYESTDPDVLDGAVFAYVTTAGTDPEVILVLEARKAAGSALPTWHFALARFSDMALTVDYRGKVVFSAPLIPFDAPVPDPKHRYRLFRDRTIPPVEDASDAGPGTSTQSTSARPNP